MHARTSPSTTYTRSGAIFTVLSTSSVDWYCDTSTSPNGLKASRSATDTKSSNTDHMSMRNLDATTAPARCSTDDPESTSEASA